MYTKLDYVIAGDADVPHTKVVDEEGKTLGDFIGTDNMTVDTVIALVSRFNLHLELVAAVDYLYARAHRQLTTTAEMEKIASLMRRVIDAAMTEEERNQG